MLSIIRRIRTLAPTCLSVGLGAFFAIMTVPSSVTSYFEFRYCSQFKPVRNPAAQGTMKIAAAIDLCLQTNCCANLCVNSGALWLPRRPEKDVDLLTHSEPALRACR